MQKLKSLEAWNQGRILARLAYELTLEPPLSRHFRLADQIRGSAPAIPAHIAEGYALATTPQFIRCLRIALGSAMELSTQLELVEQFHLAPADRAGDAVKLCNRVIALLIGLIRRLAAKGGRTLPASPFPLPHHSFDGR
ncbi:MAG: four helix bundle protein [Gemmatimonadales bacterium]